MRKQVYENEYGKLSSSSACSYEEELHFCCGNSITSFSLSTIQEEGTIDFYSSSSSLHSSVSSFDSAFLSMDSAVISMDSLCSGGRFGSLVRTESKSRVVPRMPSRSNSKIRLTAEDSTLPESSTHEKEEIMDGVLNDSINSLEYTTLLNDIDDDEYIITYHDAERRKQEEDESKSSDSFEDDENDSPLSSLFEYNSQQPLHRHRNSTGQSQSRKDSNFNEEEYRDYVQPLNDVIDLPTTTTTTTTELHDHDTLSSSNISHQYQRRGSDDTPYPRICYNRRDSLCKMVDFAGEITQRLSRDDCESDLYSSVSDFGDSFSIGFNEDDYDDELDLHGDSEFKYCTTQLDDTTPTTASFSSITTITKASPTSPSIKSLYEEEITSFQKKEEPSMTVELTSPLVSSPPLALPEGESRHEEEEEEKDADVEENVIMEDNKKESKTNNLKFFLQSCGRPGSYIKKFAPLSRRFGFMVNKRSKMKS